jgi:hypothetical protein
MKGAIRVAIVVSVLLAAVSYAGDYISVRYRMAKGRDTLLSVTIETHYAIHKKDGKTEYDFAPDQTQVCVRSLFPHFGYQPCWYVNRPTQRQIDI